MFGIQSPLGVNSTETAADSFTGGAEWNKRPDVMVSLFSDDQDGTLFFDFSVDGQTWQAFPSSGFSVIANTHEFHTAIKGPRYFRVRWSSSSPPTTLQIYTYYGVFRQANAPLNQILGADADAIVVRPYPTEIDKALGRLGGIQQADKFGYSTGLGTAIQLGTPSTWVDLWSYGGLRTSPTSTFTPYHASSSSADTDIDITWTYLDANGDEQTVTVATDASDGQTPVSLGITAQELYRGKSLSDIAGNVACATTSNFTDGVPTNQNEVLAYITANDNKTLLLARRIPANKTAILRTIYIYLSRASGAAGAVDLVLQKRESGGIWTTERAYEVTTSAPVNEQDLGLQFPALSDFRVRLRDVSDVGSTVAGSINFDLIEV